MHHFDLNDYKIVEEIGVGGMARVYKAVQLKLDRFVVIKEMSPALYKDPSFRERFAREAKICAKLSHPHIVQIYDVVVQENGSYLSIEYIEGGDLGELMKGPVDINRVFQLVNEMCSALDYAHSKGIIHRDVKKQNILIRANGCFVLADFGIAKAGDMGTQMTMVGSAVGSPKYMSPEQAQGEQIDGRSDYYSLGIVLFEILSGTVPFNADSSIAIALQHLNSPIPKLPPTLSALDPFFEKILAKSPNDRYSDGQEVIDGFIQCLKNIDEKILISHIEQSQNLYLNHLASSGSYKAKTNKVAVTKNNKNNLVFAGIATIAVLIGLGLFFNHSQKSENTYIQGKLASAYKNLQTDDFAQALVDFKSVLNVDSGNEVAIDSLVTTKEMLFEYLQKLLQEEKFEKIKFEIEKLNNEFDDDKEISNFLLKYEQAKIVSLAQKNKIKQVERIEVFFKQAEQNNRLIYPENDNAVMYLNELITLQPDKKETTTAEIQRIAKKSINQIESVIKEKDYYLANTLLDQYEKLFGQTDEYLSLKKNIDNNGNVGIISKKELDSKRNSPENSTQEYELFISNFDYKTATYKNFHDFYKQADTYLYLQGNELKTIKKINDTINNHAEIISEYFIDEININHIPSIDKYTNLAQNNATKISFTKLKTISDLKNQDIKIKNSITARINSAEKTKIVKPSEFKKFLNEWNSLKNMRIRSKTVDEINEKLVTLISRTIEDLSVNKKQSEAKKLLDEAIQAKLIAKNSNLLQTLGMATSTEIVNNTTSSSHTKAILKSIDENNLFPPSPDNAIEKLQASEIMNALSKEEHSRLVDLVYQSSFKNLRELSQEGKFDLALNAYKTTIKHWEQLPPTSNTRDLIVKIYEKTLESKNKQVIATNTFNERKKELTSLLKNKELEKSLIKLEYLLNNKEQFPSELVGSLKEIENQTHQLLLEKLDEQIEEKDFSMSEKLFELSAGIFPNDEKLELRKIKIQELKEKKVKIIGF
jgi:serine/threonine protein kinase